MVVLTYGFLLCLPKCSSKSLQTSLKTRSHDPFLRIRFSVGSENRIVWKHWKWPSDTRICNFEKTDENRTCSIFIRHSAWKMKGADKFGMMSLWLFWRQIEDSLLILKIGSCEHTTNNLPTFSPQKRNLEIGPSERLLPILWTKNRILKIGLCERALRKDHLLNVPSFPHIHCTNHLWHDLKGAYFSDFFSKQCLLNFKVHFLQGILSKISIFLLVIMLCP